jgi:hypothetical protein
MLYICGYTDLNPQTVYLLIAQIYPTAFLYALLITFWHRSFYVINNYLAALISKFYHLKAEDVT